MILSELLKTIAYIIVILLLILLCILLLILFVPVLYRFNFNSSDGFVLKGNLKLLFGVVRLDIENTGEEKIKIKIFGKQVKKVNDHSLAKDSQDEAFKNEEELFNMSVKLQNIEGDINDTKVTKKNFGLKNKINSIFEKIKNSVIKCINVIKNIIYKIGQITDFLSDENFINAFSSHKGRILKILTHLGPKKSDLVLEFGLEEPDKVGYLLAALACFYPAYERWLKIEPYFDENIFRLNGEIKGRAYIYYLFWHFIRVYFSKSVKNIRNKYKTSM